MSGNKHSLWWSYGLSAAVVLITLLVVAWFAKDRVYDFFIQHMRDELQSRAITVDQSERLKSILRNVAPARCRLKGLFFMQAAYRHNGQILRDGNQTRGVV